MTSLAGAIRAELEQRLNVIGQLRLQSGCSFLFVPIGSLGFQGPRGRSQRVVRPLAIGLISLRAGDEAGR